MSNLIAAYIDGELDSSVAKQFELHLESCEDCRSELRAHQLFICELDAALAEPTDVAVPRDFSKVVAARATSDMSGVRSRSEHRKALFFSVVLALTSFALLGTATSESGLLIVRRFLANVWSIVSFIGSTCYEIMASVVVISRVLSGKLVSESRVFGLLLVLLAFAIFLLSRLISRYHRMGVIE